MGWFELEFVVDQIKSQGGYGGLSVTVIPLKGCTETTFKNKDR